MAIRFLHTADIHFGVENYGTIDPITGLHSRLLDFKKSFEFMVDYAIRENLDLFVFAGDAYKNSYPTPTHQRVLIKLFLKLLHHGIPVVIIVGNHDHPGSAVKAHSLDVFYHIKHPLCVVFSRPGVTTIHTKSGSIQVIGVPWPFPVLFAKGKKMNNEEIKAATLGAIAQCKTYLHSDIPSILVGHLTMAGGVFSGSEKIMLEGRDPLFQIKDIIDDSILYTALGHLHKYQYINQKYPEQNPIVYSGSPDRIDFGERNDVKSCCIVTVEVGKKTEFELVKIPCRPFYQIYIHITSIEEAKKAIVDELAKYSNIDEAIVKIRYSYDYQYIKYIDMSFLQGLFSSIWCVASIECINNYKSKKKERSSELYEEKNLLDMISLYIDSNESYRVDKELYVAALKEYINASN